jgi:hypothetical protein
MKQYSSDIKMNWMACMVCMCCDGYFMQKEVKI